MENLFTTDINGIMEQLGIEDEEKINTQERGREIDVDSLISGEIYLTAEEMEMLSLESNPLDIPEGVEI